jgi:hypothetical protein
VPYKIQQCEKSKLTKLIIWKNLLLNCASLCFSLIAIDSLVAVQSTVNKEENLGLASSAVVFSVYGLTSLMLPQVLVSLMNLKWAYTIGLFMQLFYVGLNGERLFPQYFHSVFKTV